MLWSLFFLVHKWQWSGFGRQHSPFIFYNVLYKLYTAMTMWYSSPCQNDDFSEMWRLWKEGIPGASCKTQIQNTVVKVQYGGKEKYACNYYLFVEIWYGIVLCYMLASINMNYDYVMIWCVMFMVLCYLLASTGSPANVGLRRRPEMKISPTVHHVEQKTVTFTPWPNKTGNFKPSLHDFIACTVLFACHHHLNYHVMICMS